MIVVDIEASGTDPKKHSLVSIGAVDFLNPEREFYEECRIWDGAHVMPEALAVNGFSEKEIINPSRKDEGDIAKSFLSFALASEEHTLAGQNPSFDRDFIRSAIERVHGNWVLPYRTIDLHSLCWMHMIKSGYTVPHKHKRSDLNSDTILRYVGLLDEPKPHHALTGARMEAESFSRLLFNKSLLEAFKDFPIPWLGSS